MSESRITNVAREVSKSEVSNFSIVVLGYDRENPREGQPSPAELLHDMAEWRETQDRRKVWASRIVQWILIAIIGTSVTTWGPQFVHRIFGL